MWIRSPTFDCFWILSGLPVAFALAAIEGVYNLYGGSIPYITMLEGLYLILIFQLAHSLSPIVMAWLHPEFRRHMLGRPLKFIGLPALVMALCLGAGWWTQGRFDFHQLLDQMGSNGFWQIVKNPNNAQVPIIWVTVVYLAWNTWHFGKQNFGVASLYRHRSGTQYGPRQRRIDWLVFMAIQGCVGASFFFSRNQPFTMLVYMAVAVGGLVYMAHEAKVSGRMISPRIVFVMGHTLTVFLWSPWSLAINGLNHWLVSIGLAAHVTGNRHRISPAWFAIPIIVFAFFLYWAMFWNGKIVLWDPRQMRNVTIMMFAARFGIGFWHFMQDRWDYQLSNKAARETIGRDLLGGSGAVATDFGAVTALWGRLRRAGAYGHRWAMGLPGWARYRSQPDVQAEGADRGLVVELRRRA